MAHKVLTEQEATERMEARIRKAASALDAAETKEIARHERPDAGTARRL